MQTEACRQGFRAAASRSCDTPASCWSRLPFRGARRGRIGPALPRRRPRKTVTPCPQASPSLPRSLPSRKGRSHPSAPPIWEGHNMSAPRADSAEPPAASSASAADQSLLAPISHANLGQCLAGKHAGFKAKHGRRFSGTAEVSFKLCYSSRDGEVRTEWGIFDARSRGL